MAQTCLDAGAPTKTYLYGVYGTTKTYNGISVTASGGAKGTGVLNTNSGETGAQWGSNVGLTRLAASTSTIDNNSVTLADFAYIVLEFSQPVTVGANFGLADLDAEPAKDQGVMFGYTGSATVAPNSYAGIGGALTSSTLTVAAGSSDLGGGFVLPTTAGAATGWYQNDGVDNRDPFDPLNQVRGDFGSTKLTKIVFIYSVRASGTSARIAIYDLGLNNIPELQCGNPDMEVKLSGFPTAQVAPGSTVTGTITCKNLGGTQAATNATCGATGLPPDATITCSPTSPQSSLAPGAEISCGVSYTAPASGSTTITGTTGATNDGNPPNNSAVTSVPVAAASSADMSTALTGFPTAAVAPGATVTGTATCTNAGPAVAANATCNVAGLPQGATVTCTPTSPQATLAVGAAMSCAVSYTAPATGTTTPTATTGADNDSVSSNNTAATTIPVDAAQSTDMAVAVSGFPTGPVAPGSTVTGTVICTNVGVTGGANTVAATNATCDVSGLPPGATVTCTPTSPQASLALGQSISCAVSFTAPPSGTVTISGKTEAGNDNIPENDAAATSVPVAPPADMAVALSGFPTLAAPNTPVTGTAVCTNAGPGAALNATCAVSGLPQGATVNCTPTSPQASLAVGASISCAVSFTAPASGDTTVTGTTGADNDFNAPNNTASTTIVPPADMAVSLSGFPATAAPGATVSGTVLCTNAGPGVAKDATCDVSGLPEGATVICTPTSPQSTLAVGASISCAVSYVSSGLTSRTITGTTGATNDNVAPNNTASTPIGPVAAQAIPTLSEWALMVMLLLMAAVATRELRRRS